eukprot:g13096.t1
MAAIQTFKDIRYGGAVNPYTGKFTQLFLDLYSPEPDPRPLRPAVVLLHGGYFTGGDKTGDSMPRLATTLAQRGYLVASINYRLATVSDVSFEVLHSQPERAKYIVEMAQEDARAAEWRVDVNRIVIGGDSAGAIAALYYAYVRHAPEGHSGNPDYSSAIHSVLAISGTLLGYGFCGHIDEDGFAPHVISSFDLQDLHAHSCKITSPPAPNVVAEISRGDVPMLLAQAVQVPSLLMAIADGGHVPMTKGLDPSLPYLSAWLSFVGGSLNLTEAHCPIALKSNAITEPLRAMSSELSELQGLPCPSVVRVPIAWQRSRRAAFYDIPQGETGTVDHLSPTAKQEKKGTPLLSWAKSDLAHSGEKSMTSTSMTSVSFPRMDFFEEHPERSPLSRFGDLNIMNANPFSGEARYRMARTLPSWAQAGSMSQSRGQMPATSSSGFSAESKSKKEHRETCSSSSDL